MIKKDFRILLADDEPGLLEGLALMLKLEGYSVHTAQCGKDAISKLAGEQPDLAFIDLKLGDMDGIEVVKAVQPLATPIVIMTAYASVESAVSSMKIGVLDYIQKPFDNSDIIAIAERFYQEKNEITASIELVSEKFSNIIFKSSKSLEAYNTAIKIKDCDIPVLLLGESGTGKEVFARLIHEKCMRSKRPFIGINCSAIPAELLESELFGYEKGAFSGAAAGKQGKFEIAGDGTIFLDEIGDMAVKLQAKLLRVLEEKSFERIGGVRPMPFRARVIASTNREVRKMIESGEFRSDLYFRLRGVELTIPPLRERLEDLEALLHYFVNRFSKSYKKKVSLSSEALAMLREYSWPGNIRELRNAVETAVLLADDNSLLLSDNFRLEDPVTASSQGAGVVDDMERSFILKILEKNRFNRTLSAKELNISRKTLYNKIKKYSIN